MGIRPRFTPADVAADLEKRQERIRKAIEFTLKYLGEHCVKIARENGDYTDRTGNLRNSIGYVIVRNGQIIYENFRRSARITTPRSDGTTATSKGSKDGMRIAQEVARRYAAEIGSGYALIVVAGMSYAFYVERKYHRDVLNSAERYAEVQLPVLLAQLKRKIGKMK